LQLPSVAIKEISTSVACDCSSVTCNFVHGKIMKSLFDFSHVFAGAGARRECVDTDGRAAAVLSQKSVSSLDDMT